MNKTLIALLAVAAIIGTVVVVKKMHDRKTNLMVSPGHIE
jgi:cytochrome c biogenesis protein ResB